jgi:hypothetical protein
LRLVRGEGCTKRGKERQSARTRTLCAPAPTPSISPHRSPCDVDRSFSALERRSLQPDAAKLIEAVRSRAREISSDSAEAGAPPPLFDDEPGVSTIDPFWLERMELRQHGLVLHVSSRDGKPLVWLDLSRDADRKIQSVRLIEIEPRTVFEVDMSANLVQRLEEFAEWMRSLRCVADR